jgi:hypothetical protein
MLRSRREVMFGVRSAWDIAVTKEIDGLSNTNYG